MICLVENRLTNYIRVNKNKVKFFKLQGEERKKEILKIRRVFKYL